MKRFPFLFTPSLLPALLLLATSVISACDEGDITDEIFADERASYVVKLTGDLRGLDKWADGYDVALAAFDDESEYSIIQKQVVTAAADGTTTLVLSGIPVNARTVELCVTNKLRRRIVTFESRPIDPATMSTTDTLSITLPQPVDVGMFATIQHHIFDGAAYNCSLCHGHDNGRAGLDLTAADSHRHLVGVASSRVADGIRVVPGDASQSVLHAALAEGNPAALRYDHSGLIDDVMRRLIDDWIDDGANE